MRIRTIKPEFFTHEGLYELEKETGLPIRVGFAGLWCAADKAGRFKWEPRRIGVSILPYDGVDFSRVLDALFTRGYVIRYQVQGIDYGAITSFKKHQFINNKEKESDLPEPTSENEAPAPIGREGESKGSIRRVKDATSTREPRVSHASILFGVEGFTEEWEAFKSHRRQLKKPLTDRAVELTLKRLEDRPDEAASALQMAIRKGWQSIEWAWYDKERPKSSKPPGPVCVYDAPPEY